jgi:hypothetical protein
MVVHIFNPRGLKRRRQRQEDQELKTSLSYKTRPSQKKNQWDKISLLAVFTVKIKDSISNNFFS